MIEINELSLVIHQQYRIGSGIKQLSLEFEIDLLFLHLVIDLLKFSYLYHEKIGESAEQYSQHASDCALSTGKYQITFSCAIPAEQTSQQQHNKSDGNNKPAAYMVIMLYRHGVTPRKETMSD